MATVAHATAVKSLNNSSGRRRFVFKTFSQRLADIEIDVYRSLDTVKAEPSDGSSFFRDCLMEWRELNTAEDFISFYEEIMPLVQTLPLVLLNKEIIFSKLLHRLQMKARLSLEPILRLISALSRDLLEDFIPFLPRVVDSVVSLLKSGADREAEIIEQIFSSWSYIMMYLQKYLIRDIRNVLKFTTQLRYFPKDYVQEFIAEAVSFLLRKAPVEQLIRGIRKIMQEVARKPSSTRKTGASALLFHAMRGTSSKFHSRAERVLRLLMDKSIFAIGDNLNSDAITEVTYSAFERLCEELDPEELKLMRNCLYDEIDESLAGQCHLHVSRLLALLLSTLQVTHKDLDYGPMIEVVSKIVGSSVSLIPDDGSTSLLENVLNVMLKILSSLNRSGKLPAITSCPQKWAAVFQLQNSSLLNFIRELLSTDIYIIKIFKVDVIRVLDNLIELHPEEVVYLLMKLCEKVEADVTYCSFLEGIPDGVVSRIRSYIGKLMSDFSGLERHNVSNKEIDETKLALLWGVICCFPHICDNQESLGSLMTLIDALDQLLIAEDDNVLGFSRSTWQVLIGGALNSYNKLQFGSETGLENVQKLIQLAKRHQSCQQVSAALANYMDSILGSSGQKGVPRDVHHLISDAENALDGDTKFIENLCHWSKGMRISTLKILFHFKMLSIEKLVTNLSAEMEISFTDCDSSKIINQGADVLTLLLSIEQTPLSTETSRKITRWISDIQTNISAGRIHETYATVLLYSLIGILHNRFSDLWRPTSLCLSVLISKYLGTLWEKFICYFGDCQSIFLSHHNFQKDVEDASFEKSSDLVKCFKSFVNPALDSTPQESIFSLLIRSLQEIPTICEARSRQLIPLFLKFLGYNIDDLSSVGSYDSSSYKGKKWKAILKEWLILLKTMWNARSFYRSQFLKDVLEIRLLDENDADIQMKVLDCLLLWKDDHLLPYAQNLKNLICSKDLREELTTWSLSCEFGAIEHGHRAYVVPLVVRILAPKVRKLKTLASRKHASVHHRRAVLSFLSQLDTTELPLFFKLLIKPLVGDAYGLEGDFLKYFTADNIVNLSWKKIYGFLHVVEDIVGTFDEFHLRPFLNLLMGIVVKILSCCTSNLDETKVMPSSFDEMSASLKQTGDKSGIKALMIASPQQLKDVRSLCLKIVSAVLKKYEDHDFGSEFWDLFFFAVRPLIKNFMHEGSSSEKPSSLFSIFLAMSRTHGLVSLLCREPNLVPDIFLILTVSTASEAVVSGVLKLIENLLNLCNELGGEHNSVHTILYFKPNDDDCCKRKNNLEILICSLYSLFTGKDARKRKMIKRPGETIIRIFKTLPKHLHNPLLARQFIDILLLFLSNKAQKSDLVLDILQVVREIVPVFLGVSANHSYTFSEHDDTSAKILNAICPLISHVEKEKRSSLCDLLVTLAENNPSLLKAGELVRELNATSAMEEDLDYDTIITAYERITTDFFFSLREEHALLVLSQCVHDLSSNELILRHSAYRALLSFVEFCGKLVFEENRSQVMPGVMLAENHLWTKSSVPKIIDKFFFKHIGNAIKAGGSSKKEWIDLLRDLVMKLPDVANLSSLRPLCSEDAEVDFFNNLIHLQKHRRARALTRFKNVMSTNNMPEAILKGIFVPMFFNILFDVQDGKLENVRNACLEALASIAAKMDWNSYHAFLMRCFREISLDQQKQKLVVKLICLVLDQFHFSDSFSDQGSDTSFCHALDDSMSGSAVRKCASITCIQILQNTVLPKMQKLLRLDSSKVDVNINVAMLKLLKLLPGETMESQLPSVIHRIANFLKNRLESIRDEARIALAACLMELGVDYLHFFLKVLQATLKRGFELHVLGYTLNFILAKVLSDTGVGKLDYCLQDLLSVVENDILGDVSEEKDVEKIASKMKETKKRASYDTLKMIAKNITFRSHALKLLSPVNSHLQKHLTPKKKVKLESMLSNIAAGIDCNPSIDQTDLFVFIYSLIEDGINNEHGQTHPSNSEGKNLKHSRVIGGVSPSSHMITVFALQLLQANLKKVQLLKHNVEVLSKLDPFVVLMSKCLGSKYEEILSACLRCLIPLIRLPLPSLKVHANEIKASLLDIAYNGGTSGSLLMESCFRLLTELLESTDIGLTSQQLHHLIQLPTFVEVERNSSPVALSLLMAIVNRKLVVPEIYDIVTQVGKLMVTSQVDSIRKLCNKILLRFLLDYPLKEKLLQQHLDFVMSNLRYEHPSGREAVLLMLGAIVDKFPRNKLDEQSKTIFLNLVLCLGNDQDNKVRSKTGEVIQLLAGRVSRPQLNSILDDILSWYVGEKKQLWGPAAQVLGLLVEVMKSTFQPHVSSILPVARNILSSSLAAVTNHGKEVSEEASPPLWKEAYYSMDMFEKILKQFPHLCLVPELEAVWDSVSELLLHPHSMVRNISSLLVSFYLKTVSDRHDAMNENLIQNCFLMQPSRLFSIAVCLCNQLKMQFSDEPAAEVIAENLIMALSDLHFLMRRRTPEASQEFWTSMGRDDQVRFLRAFQLLNPRKGRDTFIYLSSGTGDYSCQGQYGDVQFLLVRLLIKALGKIALGMDLIRMEVVFNIFQGFTSKISGEESLPYSDQLLVPVFKLCEGHAGKVVPETSKQLGQKISDTLRNTFGSENFVRAYAQIRKELKDKREKRKRDEKLMAVVDPARNAKRKLRLAAKHRDHKRRKIMSMKMQRWMR